MLVDGSGQKLRQESPHRLKLQRIFARVWIAAICAFENFILLMITDHEHSVVITDHFRLSQD